MNRFKCLAIFCLLVIVPHGKIQSQEAATPSKIRSTLQPFVDSQTLAGAVTLIASPEKILSHEAVGWMDVAAQKPMRTDCVFWIASQSKPITCTAMMILVDEGKISVDDRVDKYLPDFANQMVIVEKDESQQVLKTPSQPMLVRHLMSHTSGLPGVTMLMKPTLELLPLEQLVAGNAMLALGSEPGAKYLYSNPGINTVGRIVEVVSGMPFEEFLQARVFSPLGMNDTTFWPNDEQIARLAKSYKPSADKKSLEATVVNQLYYPLNDQHKRHAFPGGGLFSTAIDLSRFYRMLANGGTLEGKRIISEQSLAMMTTDQTGSLKAKYGFGFKADEKSFGHGGAYGTNSSFHRDQNLITIYLIQHAGFSEEGKKILPAFQAAAFEFFGDKR
jgi:CubicO group peptidase (beta-lactamase class C family)